MAKKVKQETKQKKQKKKGKSDDVEGIANAPFTGTDGKWGWFVVFNSFICNMIVDGMQYTFANFLVPISVTFGTGITSVSLIGSLLSGFYNFSGPIAGALGNKFGFRMVVITGSLVSAGGLMLSFFAPATEYLYFFYGILGGLGFGMIYMASVITTSVYFEKYRALAASLSVCGTGVGTFVFSPMGTWLVSSFGWRYALITEGGVVLVCIVCGLSFKPLEIITVVPLKAEPSSTSYSISSRFSSDARQGSVYYPTELKKTAPNEAYPTFKEALQLPDGPLEAEGTTNRRFSHASEMEMSIIRGPRPQVFSIMSSAARPEPEHTHSGKKHKCKRCCRVCCFNFWHCRCKKKNLTLGDRPLYRDDIFYGGSLTSLGVYTSSERLKYHLSVTRVPDPQELEQHASQKCCVCHQAVLRTCVTMTGINLLRSKVFSFLCVSSFFYTMSLFIPYVFIRKVAEDNGIEEDKSVWLVSALGICNTAGRLASGIVKSFFPVNAPLLVLTCLLISGVVGFALIFIINLPVLVIYSCCFGFFTAPFISLRPIIIVEFLGLEKLTNAFGLVLLSQGVASILGPPLAGFLEEHTGDALNVIYLAGTLLVISSMALLMAMLLHMRKAKRKKTVNEDARPKKNVHIREKGEKKEEVGAMESELKKQEHMYAIVPPNGGWGWLVVFCAFYCNVVADGIQLTFGVFLSSISRDIKAEYSEVALAASLMFGIHLLMGPVCCGFNNAFGLRPVTIMGSLICGIGVGVSYFSTSYWFLCLTFGVVGGIGLGLVYMNTLVITSLYFTTLLPAAIAVVVSGTGVGTMVFSGMGSFLLSTTTWQNSFLLESVMAGSMALAAVAFRPLKPLRVKLANELEAINRPEDSMDAPHESNLALLIKTEVPVNASYSSLATVQTAARGFIERAISGEFLATRGKRACARIPCFCKRRKTRESEFLVLTEVRSEQNLTRRRSYVEKAGETEKEDDSGIHRMPSSVSYRTVYTRIDIPNENLKKKFWHRMKGPIVKMFDFHLLGSWSFFLFVVIGAAQLSSFLIVLIYIKDRSQALGFGENMSVYFMVAVGASNVFWRLFLGGIGVIPGVNYMALSVSSIVIGGLATIASCFHSHILFQFAFCFAFSLAMGSFAVFRMPALVELVGVEKIENATGICLLFMGVACICAPPLSGWVLKLTRSYDPMFITSGSIIVVSGLLQLAFGNYAITCRRHRKRASR